MWQDRHQFVRVVFLPAYSTTTTLTSDILPVHSLPSQVGKQEIAGHRCVLAGSSQYLLKLFGGDERGQPAKAQKGEEAPVKAGSSRRQEPTVYKLSDKLDWEATEALVQFAYTGK